MAEISAQFAGGALMSHIRTGTLLQEGWLVKVKVQIACASAENLTKPDIHSAEAGQPLGSMPWCFSFSRHASLTQELNLPGPAAVSICSKRSSSNRMFLTVLFERSKLRFDFLSCIGIYHSCKVILDGTYHHLSKQGLKTAKPAGATNTNGLLT